MTMATLPKTRDLVLIGGGHTHALVLRKWGMNPLPGVQLTLINPGATAPYTGMLPGFVAGHYQRDDLDIDLVRLARFADARLILGAATAIDLQAQQVHVTGRPPIGFDVASIDIGITSDLEELPGFAEFGLPAKPLGSFASGWRAYLDRQDPARIVVLGAGVAGVELAMAMRYATTQSGRPTTVILIDRAAALDGVETRVAHKLRLALAEAHIDVLEQTALTSVSASGVTLEDGREIEADLVVSCAGARPYSWVNTTGLALKDGFIRVDSRLRSSDARVFACGDCAHMEATPRPKAGVFAVRQAPVLFHNLRATLSGQAGLRPFRPQKRFLKLISLGGKTAVVDRGAWTMSGPAIWRWKDSIDQAFMRQFQDLPRMRLPALPYPRAAGLREALGKNPLCGGCGSKVGQSALSRALSDLPGSLRADLRHAPGDDAAILSHGGQDQVISTDHLRQFTLDPWVMGRIAAHHALGDIWAMGAEPQAGLAQITLPRMSSELAERCLREVTAAIAGVLNEVGAGLVGGHSTIGAEWTVGLTVTGLCCKPAITLSGAQPGDALILTKPIGSGTVMAAEMQTAAPGAIVAQAYGMMQQSQARAAKILADAHAMTDVTGFGLAGHLSNICSASEVGADVDLASVPVMPGAKVLAQAGIRSTLYPQNRRFMPDAPDTAEATLLFDPQTAGGLLAAVGADVDHVLRELWAAGYQAARIGRVTDHSGQIRLI